MMSAYGDSFGRSKEHLMMSDCTVKVDKNQASPFFLPFDEVWV